MRRAYQFRKKRRRFGTLSGRAWKDRVLVERVEWRLVGREVVGALAVAMEVRVCRHPGACYSKIVVEEQNGANCSTPNHSNLSTNLTVILMYNTRIHTLGIMSSTSSVPMHRLRIQGARVSLRTTTVVRVSASVVQYSILYYTDYCNLILSSD